MGSMHTSVSSPRSTGLHCPGCLSPVAPGTPHCPACGIWLAGPQIAELRWIDAELARVDIARTQLISRRAALIDELTRLARQAREAGATRYQRCPPLRDRPEQRPPAQDLPGPQEAAAAGPRHEMSRRTAARLLLAAGASLVAIAITIFTAADWSRIGSLGRCAILLAATALVLAAPRAIARRGLAATAESVAAIGLVLTLGDAFLIQRFAGLRPGALAISAFCAVMSAAWAAYGAATGLKGPRLAAIGIAQLTPPLTAAGIAGLAGGHGAPMAGPIATGLLISAACDIVLAARSGRARSQSADAEPKMLAGRAYVAAAVAAWVCGVVLAAAGLAFSVRGPGPHLSWSDSAWLAVAFAAAAVVGVRGTSSVSSLTALATPAAVISGALAAVSLAIPATIALPASWALAVVGACGFCVSAAALTPWPSGSRAGLVGLRRSRRLDVAAGSATILAAVTAVAALPAALVALIPPNPVLPAWAGEGHAGQIASDPLSGPHLSGATVLLVLCALACLLIRFGSAAAPARSLAPAGAIGIAAATLAAGSVPAAAQLTGWAALIALTVPAAVLLVASTSPRDVLLANTAAACGSTIALAAALWSLAGAAATIAELCTLTAIFAVVALRARRVVPAVLATAGALTAMTGLAWAVPLAAGWPARYAAFAALGAAIAAVAAATALRRDRPVQSAVLDLGAIPVALIAAAVTVGQRDIFAFLAVTSALVASGTAWLRTGPRRVVAVIATGCAALAALTTLGPPLGQALLAPARILAHPWQGHDVAAGVAHVVGLPFAVMVLAASLAALASAAGAWRGSGRTSLDVIAVALPLVAAPAGLASLNGGLAYLAVVGTLLALTLGLSAWAASGKTLAPAGAALISSVLTIAWALAAPLPTILVLGCLSIAYGICAWRSRLPEARIAASCLAVVAAAAFAESVVLAAGQPVWQAGLAALGVGASAQLVAGLLARHSRRAAVARAQISEQSSVAAEEAGENGLALRADIAIEVTSWLVSAAGVGQCLGHPGTASAATAIAGITSLGMAVRADRRPTFWAGIALCYVAWCIGLAANGVTIPEPYTLPAALGAIAAGWRASRRELKLHSWLTYGPGLALLLLPSLVMAWDGTNWVRAAAVGAASVGIAIIGARTRTQAPLLAGITLAVLEAARGLAPDVVRLMHVLPGWVPAAAGGAALLWSGATYEARLRNLRAIRRSLASMS